MNYKSDISFDDLKREVVDKGQCGRCGSCVSFCEANRIGALTVGKDGLPAYDDKDKCLQCGLCYLICPQTRELNDDIKAAHKWKTPIGHYEDVFSIQARDKEIRSEATDGGLVTALLIHMLNKKMIDGAVVSRRTGLFTRESHIATCKEELLEAVGSHFSEASGLDKLGKGYTSCVPLIKTIRDYEEKPLKKLAVVGTPCQINAVRKMQVLDIVPSDIIAFTIGLFCMQCFSVDQMVKSHFFQKHDIELKDIRKINVKENFILHLNSGDVIHIPLEEIESIARPACLACDHFANDLADISVGGLGSPDGYTTTVVRSVMGRRMIADALYNGSIEYLPSESMEKFNFNKERIISLITEYSEMKLKRSKATLEQLSLS
jgi:coenzyme F420 hydrogenase subunit beta